MSKANREVRKKEWSDMRASIDSGFIVIAWRSKSKYPAFLISRAMSKQTLKYLVLGASGAAILLIILGLGLFRQGTAVKAVFGTDQVAIIRPSGARHIFKVELAQTPEQLAQGLMYRDHLSSTAGMLFIFPEVEETSMWMRNTQISLDMLFIGADNKVTHIAANNRPFDERPIPSQGPVRGVLEINAGKAAELGLAVGDKVENPQLSKANSF
jgi:uncharacterized membrane protein (UPF0127 family)